MDQGKSLEQALGQLTSLGPVEVHEDGQWRAPLAGFRSEIRTQGKHALITSLVSRNQLCPQSLASFRLRGGSYAAGSAEVRPWQTGAMGVPGGNMSEACSANRP